MESTELLDRPAVATAAIPAIPAVEAIPATATIRAIRADDYPLLRSFVRGLSRQTAYRRLMSGRMPPDEEIRRWAEIDEKRECALVALAEGRIVGVARYATESPDETDFAVVLADAWQGKGLGRQLMERLIAEARRRGLRRLTGTTLSENVAMVALARSLGFTTRRAPGGAFATLLAVDL
jgi:acetyltransferase